MMICLPSQGLPPPLPQQPTWPTAHTAHSQHCGHTALPPGQKTNPRRRQTPADAPTPLKRSMLTPFGGPRPLMNQDVFGYSRGLGSTRANQRIGEYRGDELYIYIYVCIYIYTYMYMYICIYIYINELRRRVRCG